MKQQYKPLTIQLVAALIAGGQLPIDGAKIERAAAAIDDIVNGVLTAEASPTLDDGQDDAPLSAVQS
jgi:hypothetical protein